MVARSLYVHIPFCRRRCFYCDFPIAVLGDFQTIRGDRSDGQPDPSAAKRPSDGGNSRAVAQYVDTLIQELAQTADRDRTQVVPLDTVFFGGGTPSLLAVDQLARILAAIDRHFGLAAAAEISIELDPGTFDRTKLAGFLAAGVNRFSLGVQAFQDNLLAACGRSHRLADIETAIDLLQAAQVTNWSLDLIASLPHQTADDWQDSLDRAIAAEPAHLSVYDLIVEPKTAFARRYQPGVAPLPSDDQAADFYRQASAQLRSAGYNHYEISNYARPGQECRHNLVYWRNQDYWAAGLGATSYIQGDRQARPRRMADYQAWVAAGCPTEPIDAIAAPALTAQATTIDHAPDQPIDPQVDPQVDRLLETLMVGLRLARGVERSQLITDLGDRFGAAAWDRTITAIKPFVAQAWVAIETDPAPRLYLTDPEGFLMSNQVLAHLFDRLPRQPF